MVTCYLNSAVFPNVPTWIHEYTFGNLLFESQALFQDVSMLIHKYTSFICKTCALMSIRAFPRCNRCTDDARNLHTSLGVSQGICVHVRRLVGGICVRGALRNGSLCVLSGWTAGTCARGCVRDTLLPILLSAFEMVRPTFWPVSRTKLLILVYMFACGSINAKKLFS